MCKDNSVRLNNNQINDILKVCNFIETNNFKYYINSGLALYFNGSPLGDKDGCDIRVLHSDIVCLFKMFNNSFDVVLRGKTSSENCYYDNYCIQIKNMSIPFDIVTELNFKYGKHVVSVPFGEKAFSHIQRFEIKENKCVSVASRELLTIYYLLNNRKCKKDRERVDWLYEQQKG